MSSDASASTDSNTYYEDDFSSTEEDSSQGSRRDPLVPVLLSSSWLPLHLCVFRDDMLKGQGVLGKCLPSVCDGLG